MCGEGLIRAEERGKLGRTPRERPSPEFEAARRFEIHYDITRRFEPYRRRQGSMFTKNHWVKVH